MHFLIALFAGAASAFAFEPFALWPLMLLAFAGLCELIARALTVRRALLIGWGFGVGQFCVGLNWIATAFTYQAAMPAWLGWVAVLLLSLYLAIYPAIAVGLAWRFGRTRPIALALALAGTWAICEWLRATMFTGFAWNPVGVSLVDTPWRGASAFLGTYGLSALVVATGAFGWLALRQQWKPAASFALVASLLLTLPKAEPHQTGLRNFDVTGNVHHFNGDPAPSTELDAVTPSLAPRIGTPIPLPSGPPLPPSPPAAAPAPDNLPLPAPLTPHSALVTGAVRIVQPNIGQADKWREGFDQIAATRLLALSTKRYPDGSAPDTIYWPEAAVTEPLLDQRTSAARYVAFERQRAVRSIHPGQLLATGGIGLMSRDGATIDAATNSVFILDSAGAVVGRYDKAHLVPYGEYLPMRPILSAIGLSRLAPGNLDFQPGPGARTLDLPNGQKMGVQICYEIIFSGEVVDPRHRPDYLFNPSNDAWFGAWGPPQHLAQARLRAAEEALPIIRATPTGVSAMIDATGALVATVGAAQAGIIDIGMPSPGRPTLFARLGNLIPLLLGFLMLGIAIALGRSHR